MAELQINQRQYLELEKIAFGAFLPLTGFMNGEEFSSVVNQMRLPTGTPFPLPILMDVSAEQARRVRSLDRAALVYQDQEVGQLFPADTYTCDKEEVALKVFGTKDAAHPGVDHFYRMGECFIGGRVELSRRVNFEFSDYEITPAASRAHFARSGWKTVVGFQTRNVPHRAHEYLQRVALELADGIFIQPLVGRKKRGDYHPLAILAGYRALIDGFLPPERVLLGILSTAMRYAGPREAVFHALIRRNYGCTHFIIGRDHAGVGNYYEKYAAHALARTFAGELGIEILYLYGPFHCRACGGIVTEKTCPHLRTAPHQTRQISGTDVRATILGQGTIPAEVMRPEVIASLKGLPVLIDEEDE